MKRKIRILIWLMLAALALRLLSLFTFNFIDSGGGSDTVTYLLLARNIFAGKGYTEFGIPHTAHPPFYPIMVGLFWHVLGDPVKAGQLVSVLAGAFLVLPVFLLARSLFNRRTALYAGLFTAVFPILVYGSVETFAESLYTFILLSALAIFWITFQGKGVSGMIPAGALFGLAFLTHPAGLAFLPLCLLFLLIGQLFPGRSPWLRWLIRSVLLLLTFSLICSPYWLYLQRVSGGTEISGSSHYQDLTMRLAQARGMTESEVIFLHMERIFHPDYFPHRGKAMGLLAMALHRPGELREVVEFNIRDGYRELVKSAGFLGVPPWFLILILAGMVFPGGLFFLTSLIRRRDLPVSLFLLLLFSPALVFLLVTIEHRYFYPFMPLGLIILARILSGWEESVRASGSRLKKGVYGLLIGIIIGGMVVGSGDVIYRKWKKIGIPYEYRLIGEWMQKNIPGINKENVMMFHMGVSYYAGCRWNVFYWGDYPGLCDYLRKRNIRYLIIDDYKLYMIHPALRFLLHAATLPQEMKVVKENSFGGRKVRLLEYRPNNPAN